MKIIIESGEITNIYIAARPELMKICTPKGEKPKNVFKYPNKEKYLIVIQKVSEIAKESLAIAIWENGEWKWLKKGRVCTFPETVEIHPDPTAINPKLGFSVLKIHDNGKGQGLIGSADPIELETIW